MIPEQAAVFASHWLSFHIEDSKTFAEQRQNPLVSDGVLFIKDRVEFADKTNNNNTTRSRQTDRQPISPLYHSCHATF